MKIVTSGSRYIDIDAYAGCIAYSYLLNLKGIPSKAVSTAKLNESITKELLELDTKLDNYLCKEDDEFIIVDVSDKDFFDNIVIEDRVIEVIDHHVGYENYWKEKLNNNSKIEFIGSVATIIYELYEKDGLQNKITKDIEYLMMSAILDNTLNFKAKVTTDRDINVYRKLQEIVGINDDYASKYFMDCQRIIENDLKTALKNDTKIGIISKKLPKVISQLTVWNKDGIFNNQKMIKETLTEFGDDWIFNLICLKDGKSYIMASNDVLLKNMQELLVGNIKDGYLECESVWLRKEIIKQASKVDTWHGNKYYNIRPAKLSDCKELSYVKRNVWETTYRGIYPDEKLDNYDYNEHEKKFEKIVSNQNVQLFVVEYEGKIIGYMSCGRPIRQFKDFEQEIGLLYLLKECQGTGLGKKLFNMAYEIIKGNGYTEFFISCNKYNISAQKFYKKMGGEIIHVDEDNEDKSIPQVKFLYI